MSISFDFKDKVVVITGGARGIGLCVRKQFERAGARVCVIDLLENDYFVGDLSCEKVLEQFASKVIADFGKVDFLINNAAPLMKGIDECSYSDFEYALKVGVTAPFYLSKLFALHFAKGNVLEIQHQFFHARKRCLQFRFKFGCGCGVQATFRSQEKRCLFCFFINDHDYTPCFILCRMSFSLIHGDLNFRNKSVN